MVMVTATPRFHSKPAVSLRAMFRIAAIVMIMTAPCIPGRLSFAMGKTTTAMGT